jgi:hypothetical protein
VSAPRPFSYAWLWLGVLLCAPCLAQGGEYPYPERVRVLPVFFVPADQTTPSAREQAGLQRHMLWAQRRYRELLGGRDTFELARDRPDVFRASFDLNVYLGLKDDAAQYMSELLAHYGFNRFTCPFVFVVVLANPCEDVPAGGGRPCNGDYNRGSGVVVLSSYGLNYETSFQSTLRHELGHSFGLPHVDVYGYSMTSSRSIMSYNRLHHTRGFRPSKTPGKLIPEDLRGLARNDRVFSTLTFSPARDSPWWYRLKRSVSLGPMVIPDEARYVEAARARSGLGVGYELRRAGVRLRQESSWNRAQVSAELGSILATDPHSTIEALHEGQPVLLARGYELFQGRRRVGVHEDWNRADALANLRLNQRGKKAPAFVGRYRGRRLLWARKRGYELFLDGDREGPAQSWSDKKARADYKRALKRHRKKIVTARLNGVPLR